MSATEDCQTSCMCIKSSQIAKTYSDKSCGFHGHVPVDSYFSEVLHYITQQLVPYVSQENTTFIFKGLESEKINS